MSKAMTEICAWLKNWFDKGQPKISGRFTIQNGTISRDGGESLGIAEGQYYRIMGSALNTGVWRYPEPEGEALRLRDEEFTGTVWLLAIPPAVEALASELTEWLAKYDNVDSSFMSPFTSESFAGYSYSKSSGGSSGGPDSGSGGGWQSVFAGRLRPWKRI